jgi:cobalamin biosynthesis Mg chelatase CobN
MNVGKRHLQGPARGRALFVSMSVIVLLALACFPVFAQAECVSSSCVQYTESIPNVVGGNPSTPHKHPPVAKAADNGGASAPTGKAGNPASNGETNESAGDESSSEEGGVPATGNGGGTGQGSPGGSANHGSGTKVQHGGQNTGTPTSQSSSSSSSPLIPILIAIAVLAAISVGVVMIRQRRQRRGPTTAASPKAS